MTQLFNLHNMATFVFNDIDDFQKHVGGATNKSMDIRSLSPWIEKTAENHIIPWLGRTIWDQLVDLVDDGNVDYASAEGKLLVKVCSPLAMLTMYEYSFIGAIQFGEAGLFRLETEDYKSAYKYQEANYRESMLNNGYEGIELMQRFLDQNADDYANWDQKEKARSLIINYASELRDAYSKYLSRYTFEIVRSLVEDVELFAIVPILGQAQYDDIKTAILAGTFSAPQKSLLKYLRKVVGNFVVHEGILRQWVLLDGRNLIQNVQRSIDSRHQSLPPESGSTAVSLLLMQSDRYANRYIAYITDYLNDNINDYPLYKAFLDEQALEAETIVIDEREEDICNPYMSDNSGRKGVVQL